MYTKVTLLIEQTTENPNQINHSSSRIFGWSESHYTDKGVTDTSLYGIVQDLANRRAKLLSNQGAIKGFRFQQVAPSGASRSFRYQVQGTTKLACDDPENALLFNLRSGDSSNRRILTLRGIPDDIIKTGEYVREKDYHKAINSYLEGLRDNFKFKGKDMTGARAKINRIGADGLVQTAEDFPDLTGKKVQILRTIGPGHRAKGIITEVTAYTNLRRCTILTTPAGSSTGGTIREVKPDALFTISYLPEDVAQPTVGDRQTGRPFNLSRGRRSAKYS